MNVIVNYKLLNTSSEKREKRSRNEKRERGMYIKEELTRR